VLTNPSADLAHTPVGAFRPPSAVDRGARLVSDFEAALAHRSAEEMARLHHSIVHLVGGLKAEGVPIEGVVVALKALLRGHGPPGWVPSLRAERMAAGISGDEPTVYARLFSWCLEAYFGGSTP
jgi:hypothetical protein